MTELLTAVIFLPPIEKTQDIIHSLQRSARAKTRVQQFELAKSILVFPWRVFPRSEVVQGFGFQSLCSEFKLGPNQCGFLGADQLASCMYDHAFFFFLSAMITQLWFKHLRQTCNDAKYCTM